MIDRNLTFIAIFIAIYESFSDYVIECPRQLFEKEMIRCDLQKKIQESDRRYKAQKQEAIQMLNNVDRSKLSLEQIERLELLAHYNYIKLEKDGYVQWLVPQYDKLIKSRKIKVKGKSYKNILLNSIMFFVEQEVLEKKEMEILLEIRELRNYLVHEMASLLMVPVKEEWEQLFYTLINLYKKINNYWCINFELAIVGNEIPKHFKLDVSNIITVDLRNLFLSIDMILGTKFVMDKKYVFFNGLYDGICLAIIDKNSSTEV